VSEDLYRLSFEAVAEQYERARPTYADDALQWLADRIGIAPGRRVLDLAAGTGKLTRQLVALGASIVAVEPGDAMRALLERVVPEAESLAGSAEAIPLADASVDAITVGQAYHWFRPDEALAEMHRVLRPAGSVALLWNQWDDNDPLQREIDELIEPLRPRAAAQLEEWDGRRGLETSPLFGLVEERLFHHRRTLTADQLVEWVSSTSAVVTAPPAEQARIEDRVRSLAGDGDVELTIKTLVLVLDRAELS
jgi:ubiquinone/menaquinone biosynthesis C-methylase UbiE